MALAARRAGRQSRRAVAIAALALAACWLACALLYDTSWDGESYHLPGLLAIAQGWNPIYDSSDIGPANLQANGLWTLRAALYAVTGSAEGAKALNFAFALAALFTLVPAWSALRARPLTTLELALAYAAVGNPVTLGQLFTFYVDGTVYAAGTVLLAALLLTGCFVALLRRAGVASRRRSSSSPGRSSPAFIMARRSPCLPGHPQACGSLGRGTWMPGTDLQWPLEFRARRGSTTYV